MLTLDTQLKALQQALSYGETARHCFGDSSKLQGGLEGRVEMKIRHATDTSTPFTRMQAHDRRRGVRVSMIGRHSGEVKFSDLR